MRRPLFYAALFFAAAVAVAYFFLPSLPPKNDVSRIHQQVWLGGNIVSGIESRKAAFGEDRLSFVLSAERFWSESFPEGRAVKGKTKVFTGENAKNLRWGDTVVLSGELTRPERARNPGGFDARAYLERSGIRSVLFADKKEDIRVVRRDASFLLGRFFHEAREFLCAKLDGHFSARDAAFLKALFFGERADLADDFKELFIRTGTMHILAVSGFNIAFLLSALALFLKPLRLGRNVRLAIMLIAVWLYCLVVGWQAPVVRASIMASVFILGKILGRKGDMLNSLGFAALVILFLNPRQIFDVGFQLSFLAVFGLIVYVPKLLQREEPLPHETFSFGERSVFYLKQLFWSSLVAIFVTLPITVQNFYIVTPLALLANMIVVPLAFVIFIVGFIYFLFLPLSLLWPITVLLKILIALFVSSLYAVEHIPGACVIVGKLAWPLWVLLTAGIFYWLGDKRIRIWWVRVAALVLFSSSIFLAQAIWRERDQKFQVTVLDVGQGDSIYVQFPFGGNMLIDAGHGIYSDKGRTVVAPFLKYKGVSTIDALVVSHPQEDHIGGMPSVLREFRVRTVLDAGRPYDSQLYRDLKKALEIERAEWLQPGAGMAVQGYKNVNIEVLSPFLAAAPKKNINDDSLVLKMSYGDTSFLFTGDIQGQAMADIVDSEASLKADFLKVPHHGAKLDASGERFVALVRPAFSAISVGKKNPFHHPAPHTLEVLQAIPGNRVLRTDEQGAIGVVSDGKTLSFVGP